MLTRLEAIAHEVVRRMEKSHFTGKPLTLKVKFADFRQITRSRTVEHASVDADDMMSMTRRLFAPVEIPRGVRLLGLTVSNACEGGEHSPFVKDRAFYSEFVSPEPAWPEPVSFLYVRRCGVSPGSQAETRARCGR